MARSNLRHGKYVEARCSHPVMRIVNRTVTRVDIAERQCQTAGCEYLDRLIDGRKWPRRGLRRVDA